MANSQNIHRFPVTEHISIWFIGKIRADILLKVQSNFLFTHVVSYESHVLKTIMFVEVCVQSSILNNFEQSNESQ
jgi:hypothetical protein